MLPNVAKNAGPSQPRRPSERLSDTEQHLRAPAAIGACGDVEVEGRRKESREIVEEIETAADADGEIPRIVQVTRAVLTWPASTKTFACRRRAISTSSRFQSSFQGSM